MMTYEAWRISYQSSEQAARAAYAEAQELQRRIEEGKDLLCEEMERATERTQEAIKWRTKAQELEAQLEAIGAGGVEPLRKPVQQKGVWVDAGALQMVLNALERDALEGKQARAEMRLALMQSIAHPTPQGLDAREFPAMTPELASILGLMCFQCISFAQALRAGGHQINTRAEDEQAAVLHWMLSHYFKHGETWRDAAAEDMKRIKADTLTAQAKQGATA